jgi:hypothetical protein
VPVIAASLMMQVVSHSSPWRVAAFSVPYLMGSDHLSLKQRLQATAASNLVSSSFVMLPNLSSPAKQNHCHILS